MSNSDQQNTPPIDLDLSGAEAVKNAIIAIAEIVPHPRNYNLHTDTQKQRLQASERRYGQVRSVVVQAGAPGRYMLVAGHGYLEARKAEGKTHVRADIIPATWSALDVEGYLVADNELARMSQPDTAMLVPLLQDQIDAGQDLFTLGLDETTFHDLLASLDAPPSLDDLEKKFGAADEEGQVAFWPTLRLQIPQVVKDQFDSLMAQMPGSSEAVKFAALLACVDVATAQTLDVRALETLMAQAASADDDEGSDGEWDNDDDPDDSDMWDDDAPDADKEPPL